MKKTWIEEQLDRAREIPMDDFTQPQGQVDLDYEEVVGELSNFLFQLYTLAQMLVEQAERTALDAKYARQPEEQERLIRDCRAQSFQANLMERVFWLEVRRSIDNWNSQVGLREGGQIVASNSPPAPRIINIGFPFSPSPM